MVWQRPVWGRATREPALTGAEKSSRAERPAPRYKTR
jgi:hypothetical protein